ncbi:beta-galactosidase [Yinghuangia seranimata]|uniref:beta-galactosidase n=1 Tax=Yinghuangia seranimata TaxID=408067 RepID=UPI00248AEE47|nr:beta-galactosidase [Yinghuangia seranimata]MDI2125846.1 beta-galactosidase [Yinghuangia seranimata]
MRVLRSRLGGLAFGGDYNPEQWDAATRAEDLRLMADAKVNMVNLGVFAWARVEPARDAYDFTFFDEVMDGLAAHGVTADLATMTASPPPWLGHEHPEILPVTADGTVLSPGGRQHFCPSSPVYRDRAARLVEALATHYRDHPALGLWHIGNEYGIHVAECFCDVSAADFRRWLHERYAGDIDALNAAWSTDFWSQRYAAFDQVLPPRAAPTYPNPSQQLDFKRFSSEALRACFEVERDVLRRVTPDVPVTTNFLAGHKTVDVYDWAPHMDAVAFDSYPDPHEKHAHIGAALSYDALRGAVDGAPWLLTEQAPSAVNWRSRNGGKAPGQMRLWSWQAVAHGADAVMYFQWRQSRGGAEKFHSGMVPHGGADTRVHREVRALGRELAAVPELAGTHTRNEVAVLFDWNSWWALELDSHPSEGVRCIEQVLDYYGALFEAGVGIDVVHPSADLSGYKLVVLPGLYLLSEEHAGRVVDFVAAGGHLVVSFFTGIVDEHDRVHLGGYPAPLGKALGLHVEEFWPTAEGESVALRAADGEPLAGDGSLWREDVVLAGARPELLFAGPDWEGRPAATVHTFGGGTARYVATRPHPADLGALVARAVAESGAAPVLPGLPAGVEAALRRGDGYDVLVLLNHGDTAHDVDLPEPRADLLAADRPEVRRVALEPRGVAVLGSPHLGGPRPDDAAPAARD